MLYDIEKPINKFNKLIKKYGTTLKYEEDKFIVDVENEEENCLWEVNEFIRDELCILIEYKNPKEEKTKTGYKYAIDTETMNHLDKIWEKLGEKFYREEIDEGFMNRTWYDPKDNDLTLNIHHYNEETITKIKNVLGAKRWYIVFDSWGEDMYIVYQF